MPMRSSDIVLLILLLLHSTAETTVAGQQLFAYESGKCEKALAEVVGAFVKTRVRQVFNPLKSLIQTSQLQYDLYTPLNPQQRQLLRPGDVNMLKNSHFNGKWPLRISIHGWTGQSTSCSNAAIKDAYLSRGNFNIIIMDWRKQSQDINYGRVSKQLHLIAANLAKFLHFLHDYTGIPFENIYLVGHSAGAHIAGLTGKALRPARLGVIYALDPAGLTQLELGPTDRLAPTDALYVESIHTDLKLLGNPMGTHLSQVAFFANWGRGQPHCPNATGTEFDSVCDHFAAIYYFAESVRRPNLFGAMRCDSLRSVLKSTCKCQSSNSKDSCAADEFMGGEPAVYKKRGNYYLSTLSWLPFGTADGLVHIRPPIPSTIYAKRKQFV